MTRNAKLNLKKTMAKIKPTPRKFAGNKPLAEIKKAVESNGGFWDQSRFEKGSDYVTFAMKKDQPRIVYNTFNGTFITQDDDGATVTGESPYDGVPWFDEILNFIYTEQVS